MKYLIFVILILLFYSCKETKQLNQLNYKYSVRINKIETKNNWYLIYAYRNDTTFMIVSKKSDLFYQENKEIKVGNYYNLILSSIIPVINGVKMIPQNYLDFKGIQLDDQTYVNIDPDKSIYDIYSSDNLKGLYLIK